MQKEILEYINYCKLKNYKQITLKDLKRRLNKFYEFVTVNYFDVKEITDITRDIVKSFEKHLSVINDSTGKIMSVDRRTRYLSALKNFFVFLEREDKIYINPTVTIAIPRGRKEIVKDVLTIEEMQKLIKSCNHYTLKSIRDRAILELLYSTALRADELCSIHLQDIDFEEQTLFVRKPKLGIERIVPFGESAKFAVKRYLEKVRPVIPNSADNDFLFVTLEGKRPINSIINRIVKEWAKSAEIQKRVTSHTFRHSCATHMLKKGADIRHVQKHLGHKVISTTERYLRLEIEDLKEVHRRTHPRETEDWGL
jgi:integrase/recombinase XerD